MTVAELIARLRAMQQDMIVIVPDDASAGDYTDAVSLGAFLMVKSGRRRYTFPRSEVTDPDLVPCVIVE